MKVGRLHITWTAEYQMPEDYGTKLALLATVPRWMIGFAFRKPGPNPWLDLYLVAGALELYYDRDGSFEEDE